MKTSTILLYSIGSLLYFSCNDGGGAEKNPEPGPVGVNNAPPLFEYVPGEPGRAVGVRAEVSVDSVDLVTEPLEMALLPPDEGASDQVFALAPEATLDRAVSQALALDAAPTPGQEVESVGTVNGDLCYMAYTVAGGSLGGSESIVAMLLFGREGMYKLGSHIEGAYYPPDWGNLSYTVGIGCVAGDQPDRITAEYLRSLSAITVSVGIVIYSQGYSVFTSPGKGIVRAFQYNSGVGMSVSLFTLMLPVSFTVK